jgi:hypothetical protein
MGSWKEFQKVLALYIENAKLGKQVKSCMDLSDKFADMRQFEKESGRDPFNIRVPDEMSGNRSSWKIIRSIFHHFNEATPISGDLSDMEKVFAAAEHISIQRCGKFSKLLDPIKRLKNGKKSMRDLSIYLRTWSERLYELKIDAGQHISPVLNLIKKNPMFQELILERLAKEMTIRDHYVTKVDFRLNYPQGEGVRKELHSNIREQNATKRLEHEGFRLLDSTLFGLRMLIIGSLYFIWLPGSEIPLMLTSEHFTRTIWTLKAFSNTLYMLSVFFHERLYPNVLAYCFEQICDLAIADPDGIGEAIKASRSRLLARLAERGSPLKNQEANLASTWDKLRQATSLKVLGIFRNIFTDKMALLNFMNIFKAIPHPDCDLHKAFLELDGLREPNSVDPEGLDLFIGSLRKTLYLSASSSGYYIRAMPTQPGQVTSTLTQSIINSLSSAGRKVQDLASIPSAEWKDVHFEVCRELRNIKDVRLKAEDKSSAPETAVDYESLEEMLEFAAIKSYTHNTNKPDSYDDYLYVNDRVRYFKSKHEITGDEAIADFDSLIALHEAFEDRYPNNTIEEIPPEELEAFLLATPAAARLVGTEPKYGEKNKRITRVFYMAHPMIKALTQRVERIAKQLSRKQLGVTITKNESSRAMEMNDLVTLMGIEVGGYMPLFVSFDMSKFSQKFAMVLIREYGKVMAELTGIPCLRRLDIVFRCSIVYHSTRNYFNYIGGILGGFEGFLNFIWTSIHAVIMRIALEHIGREGTVLTYSDDGVLMLYEKVDESSETIMSHLTSIQETYSTYGLKFHFGKTIVSWNVWEYLGEMCVDRRYIPMFVKECTSIGIIEEGTGIKTLVSSIGTIASQSRAASMAGANPIMIHSIMYRECIFAIKARALKPPLELCAFLLMWPVSLGGLRTPSPFELSTSLSSPEAAYFTDEVVWIGATWPDYLSAFNYLDSLNPITPREMYKQQILGHYYASNIPKFVVDGLLMKSYREVAEKYRVPKASFNAISDIQVRELMDCFEGSVNIPLHIFTEVAKNTEAFREAQLAKRVITGVTAAKLMGTSFMRRHQSYITRKENSTITSWCNARGTCTLLDSRTSLNIFFKNYLRVSTRFMKPEGLHTTPMWLYTPTTSPCPDYVLAGCLSMAPGTFPYDNYYRDNKDLHGAEHTTLAWSIEMAPESKIAKQKKLLRILITLISTDSQYIDVANILAHIFKLPLPSISSEKSGSLARLKGSYGSGIDARSARMGPYTQMSTVSASGLYRYYFHGSATMDRTTPIIAMTWAISQFGFTQCPPNKVFTGDNICLYLSAAPDAFFGTVFPQELFLRYTYEQVAIKLPKLIESDSTLTSEFETYLEEVAAIDHINQSIRGFSEVLISEPGTASTQAIMPTILVEGCLETFHRWMSGISRLSTNSLTMISPASCPAIVLKMSLGIFICSYVSDHCRMALVDSFIDKTEIQDEFIEEFITQRDKLVDAGIGSLIGGNDIINNIDCNDSLIQYAVVSRWFTRRAAVLSVLPTIVRPNRVSIQAKISDSNIQIYDKIISHLEYEVIKCMTDNNHHFLQDVLEGSVPQVNKYSLDDVADTLRCISQNLRPSVHRSEPFNTGYAIASLSKYFMIKAHAYQVRYSKSQATVTRTKVKGRRRRNVEEKILTFPELDIEGASSWFEESIKEGKTVSSGFAEFQWTKRFIQRPDIIKHLLGPLSSSLTTRMGYMKNYFVWGDNWWSGENEPPTQGVNIAARCGDLITQIWSVIESIFHQKVFIVPTSLYSGLSSTFRLESEEVRLIRIAEWESSTLTSRSLTGYLLPKELIDLSIQHLRELTARVCLPPTSDPPIDNQDTQLTDIQNQMIYGYRALGESVPGGIPITSYGYSDTYIPICMIDTLNRTLRNLYHLNSTVVSSVSIAAYPGSIPTTKDRRGGRKTEKLYLLLGWVYGGPEGLRQPLISSSRDDIDPPSVSMPIDILQLPTGVEIKVTELTKRMEPFSKLASPSLYQFGSVSTSLMRQKATLPIADSKDALLFGSWSILLSGVGGRGRNTRDRYIYAYAMLITYLRPKNSEQANDGKYCEAEFWKNVKDVTNRLTMPYVSEHLRSDIKAMVSTLSTVVLTYTANNGILPNYLRYLTLSPILGKKMIRFDLSLPDFPNPMPALGRLMTVAHRSGPGILDSVLHLLYGSWTIELVDRIWDYHVEVEEFLEIQEDTTIQLINRSRSTSPTNRDWSTIVSGDTHSYDHYNRDSASEPQQTWAEIIESAEKDKVPSGSTQVNYYDIGITESARSGEGVSRTAKKDRGKKGKGRKWE